MGLILCSGEIQIGWIVLDTEREGFRKLAGRIYFAVEQICCGSTARLAGKIHFQYALYLGKPRHTDWRTVVQDNDGVWLYLADFMDQMVLAFRHIQMGPVKAFTFKGIRQSRKNHSDLSSLCCVNRFF